MEKSNMGIIPAYRFVRIQQKKIADVILCSSESKISTNSNKSEANKDGSQKNNIPLRNQILKLLQFSSVQSLSRVQLFATPWTTVCQASLSITNSQSLNSCPSSWWCHPIISSTVIPFSSCLQSFPVSGSFHMSQFFTIRWPKYCNFSFSISPSSEYSGLISFRMDWLDLLAVQGTLKSLLQNHSSNSSIL